MAFVCRFVRPACNVTRTIAHRTNRTSLRCSRYQSTDAAPSSAAATSASPKITTIVDQISQLTLLETADLVSTLKQKLNIPDMPIGNFAAASGPAGGAPAAPAPEEEEEAAPKQEEKSLFTVKLQAIDASAKPKIIKEVKSMLGLSLVDSKKFVESAPKTMREGVPKEEADKIVETLKALGATVVLE